MPIDIAPLEDRPDATANLEVEDNRPQSIDEFRFRPHCRHPRENSTDDPVGALKVPTATQIRMRPHRIACLKTPTSVLKSSLLRSSSSVSQPRLAASRWSPQRCLRLRLLESQGLPHRIFAVQPRALILNPKAADMPERLLRDVPTDICTSRGSA